MEPLAGYCRRWGPMHMEIVSIQSFGCASSHKLGKKEASPRTCETITLIVGLYAASPLTASCMVLVSCISQPQPPLAHHHRCFSLQAVENEQSETKCSHVQSFTTVVGNGKRKRKRKRAKRRPKTASPFETFAARSAI